MVILPSPCFLGAKLDACRRRFQRRRGRTASRWRDKVSQSEKTAAPPIGAKRLLAARQRESAEKACKPALHTAPARGPGIAEIAVGPDDDQAVAVDAMGLSVDIDQGCIVRSLGAGRDDAIRTHGAADFFI